MSITGASVYALTRSRPTFYRLQDFWAESLARVWGLRVRCVGAEGLDPDGTYVFMANHQSFVDIIALFVDEKDVFVLNW